MTPAPSLSITDLGFARAQASELEKSGQRRRYSDNEARKVAQDFESMFLGQMIGHMTAGLKTNPTFGGGYGETMFTSLLHDEYAKQITRAGGVGVADAVYREMMKAQEVRPS
ncbi:MAG: hypothetical protein FJX47_05070 [Alphaproteobacteria bacterium]|nr:hypothetical protein [Alphaproteobacteria bacterium]